MSKYPRGVWKPLPENSTQSKITPTQFIVHTAVDAKGKTSLWNYFHSTGVGVESHFWIPWDGSVEQFMDTNVRADANYKVNDRAISVETEDDGDPEANPWNQKQIDALIDLGRWAVDEHNIPPILCPDWDKPGFGWHSMWSFTDPIRQIGPIKSPWTTVFGKTCPGKVRCWQFRTKVLPEIAKVIEPRPPVLTVPQEWRDEVIDEIVRRLQDG